MEWRSKGRTYGCPSKTCHARNPAFFDFAERDVPSDVQERLAATGFGTYDLKRCGDCGAVWVTNAQGTKVVGGEEKGQTSWLI
jgi:hypothetical protein